MNPASLLNMAKLILPKNSPWLARIEQAQQMAAQFAASPDGVRQLMTQMGKTQADVKAAVDALNNPAISGMLNRIAPGLPDQLRQAGQTFLNDGAPTGVPQNTQPLSPASPASPPSGDPLAALREKLKRIQ